MRLARRVGPRVYLKGRCLAKVRGCSPGLRAGAAAIGVDSLQAPWPQPPSQPPEAGRTATLMDVSRELMQRVGTEEELGWPTPGHAMATLLTCHLHHRPAFALPVFHSR